jgi:tricorn protease
MAGRKFAIIMSILLLAVASAAAAIEPHAGMLRTPDVSATHIAFRYANDLWLVPREGGVATPLSSPPGGESLPRFSQDGKTIAFIGNYDGGYDLYTIPATGGVPFRVTHHPSQELISDWTPDGRLAFSAWNMGDNPRTYMLFHVSADGGLPEQFPVPYGTNGVVSPDGEWLAYTPFSRDFSTWKRYRGGAAPDVWLFHLENHTSKRITDWEGSDSIPMWHGDLLYYVSDAGSSHRLNIWVYDTTTGETRQVTKHGDYDVKWPAIGPGDEGQGEIVYQLGPELRLLDLGTERSRAVRVTIPGDRPEIRPQTLDVSQLIYNRNISATGKRVVVEARGDIWTLPAEHGSPLNLTRTDGVAERSPVWSPDGQWIAFFSDASGEYELHVTQSDGRGEERQLTKLERGFLMDPVWSPDSEKIAFWDQSGRLFITDVEDGGAREVHRRIDGARSRVSWSHDSNWLAFADPERLWVPESIVLLNLVADEKHRVTSGRFHDSWPAFDREGEFLYFASHRDFSEPTFGDLEENWAYDSTDRIFAVTLRDTIPSPLLPEVDAEEWEEDDEEGDEEEGEEEDGEGEEGDEEEEDEEEPLQIDIEGFERRAILVPVDRGRFMNLTVNAGGNLIYQRNPHWGRGLQSTVQLLDFEDDEAMEKTVVSGVRGYAMSGDGNKLLVGMEGSAMAIVDAAADQSMDDMVSTAGMTVEIDPPDEWRQILRDAWRIYRDFFYAPNMHGVDWNGVYDQYEAMLDDCASREDVGYILGEMIAELNVGHAYSFGGDYEEAPYVPTGMLGCDYELGDGAYRIARIYEGASWDGDARGPLSQPGIDVDEGDYLLAVNGVPLDPAKDPWAAFQGLAGRTVTLTLSDKPEIDDDARHVAVDLLGSEYDLRYRAWVEGSRAYVEERSDGRVGYVYVPNTGIGGQNELVRQFLGQTRKDALIIDERWNGGGQVPTRFIELLNRPLANYWALRHAEEGYPEPTAAHHGPKCMIINESAGSGGDYFPFWFRGAGVGKIVGTRTWGGLVGLSGNPPLIDGGYASVPRFAFYDIDGTWGIEGHGVDPDIEVIADPALMVDGGDPQLDAAIDLMLDEIRTNPYTPTPKPVYPNRSGMGIRPEDK